MTPNILKKIGKKITWSPKIPIRNKHLSVLVNKVLLPCLLISLIFFGLYEYHFIGSEKIGKVGNAVIYTDNSDYADEIMLVLDSCMMSLNEKDIKIKSSEKIVFCTTDKTYDRKTLRRNNQSLGSNKQFLKILLLSPADYKKNRIYKKHEKLEERRLSDVVTHELVHSYLEQELGFVKNLIIQHKENWKSEGFCEYIANSSSFNISEGKSIFKENREQEYLESYPFIVHHAYYYFKSRLKTDYLLSYKKMSFQDFFETKFDEEVLEQEIREALFSEEYKFDCQ